jgi:hypothetical protein
MYTSDFRSRFFSIAIDIHVRRTLILVTQPSHQLSRRLFKIQRYLASQVQSFLPIVIEPSWRRKNPSQASTVRPVAVPSCVPLGGT